MNQEELMEDIIRYAKNKMLKLYENCAVACLPGKFVQATSTTQDDKQIKILITLD